MTRQAPRPLHKNTKLLPRQRREAYERWKYGETVVDLARHYGVSRETLYEAFRRARRGEFENRTSMNHRYRTVQYGLKRLHKTEHRLAKQIERRDRRRRRYEKREPGELVHFDTKRLPLLPGEAITMPREQLHVAVDDHTRWLVADIFPDKTQYSSAIHLEEARYAMPFRMLAAYSDNGSEYRGRKDHAFVAACRRYGIEQRFTRPYTPRTNGKAERIHRTLMTEWHRRRQFRDRDQRRKYLQAFVNYYNNARPHQGLNGQTPLERLEAFVARQSVNNAC